MFQKLRWAIQRVVRGWDDTAIWSLDSYIANIAIEVLPKIRDMKHGYMFDHDYVGEEPMKDGWLDDEKQTEIFNKMIFAMEHHVDDLEHQDKHIPGGLRAASAEDREVYNQRVKEGMSLFADYFGELWT